MATRSREYRNNPPNADERDSCVAVQCDKCRQRQVCITHERYPCCIVWTPIPLLTAILPFVGHMGIATSHGVIHDFAGPYHVSVDDLAFGRTTRYLQLDIPSEELENYDKALFGTVDLFRQQMYNFFTNNCHSMVAAVLNRLVYKKRTWWNMVVLAPWMFFCGSLTTLARALWTFLPFIIVVAIAVASGIVAAK